MAWQIADVLALLPNDYGEFLPSTWPAMQPLTGLVPTEPDFHPVLEEAFRLHGVTITVGGARPADRCSASSMPWRSGAWWCGAQRRAIVRSLSAQKLLGRKVSPVGGGSRGLSGV